MENEFIDLYSMAFGENIKFLTKDGLKHVSELKEGDFVIGISGEHKIVNIVSCAPSTIN